MAKSSRLAEGVDFYVEDGKVVFTSYYLLRRGYCCNKGCRHCPYKGDVAILPGTIQIKGLSGLGAIGGAARGGAPDDD